MESHLGLNQVGALGSFSKEDENVNNNNIQNVSVLSPGHYLQVPKTDIRARRVNTVL